MSKVCLSGASLETANMGVSALAISFVKIIKHINKKMEVTLLVGAKKSGYKLIDLGESPYNIKIVNYRMSPKAHLQEHLLWILFLSFAYRIFPLKWLRRKIINSNDWLREIDESEFIGSIHGGDSFSDIYGLSRFFFVVAPDIIAMIMKKPLVLLPQTYGPYKYGIAKKIAHFIIKRSSSILCRDKNGPDAVKKLLGNIKLYPKILFCPDMAFFLHGNTTHLPDFIETVQKEKAIPLVGININGLMYKGGYTRNNMFDLAIDYGKLMNSIIQRFLLKSNASILLIPHNNAPKGNIESDVEACEDVLKNIPENLKDRIHIQETKDSPSEIKGVIAKCNFFIGSRMHACIAALSYGIPTIGIAYSKKFIGVFESVGAGELVVDARSIDIEGGVQIVWTHFENRNFWDNILKTRLQDIKKTTIDIFEDLVK